MVVAQAGGMNWDPFQREALAELGHRLYRMRGAEASPGPGSVERAGAVAPPTRPARPVAPPPARTLQDPLLRALMRAAGTDALPPLDLDALRRDPAAKRALWPRLRALRVSTRSR
jgi:hypothetical protein